MPENILFLSHDASRTGAPILLARLLEWIRENTNYSIEILLRENGDLEPDFKSIASTHSFKTNQKVNNSLAVKAFSRILGRSHQDQLDNLQIAHTKSLINYYQAKPIDLIYSNTMTNGGVLKTLAELNCPIICHIHELELIMRSSPKWLTEFEETKSLITKFIAVSNAVKENLIDNHQIAEEKIELIYGFNPRKDVYEIDQSNSKQAILKELGIPPDAQLICASGTMDWRKSADLFIQLANIVCKRYMLKPVYFLWVGGAKEGPRFNELWYDVKKLGLEKQFQFLGPVANPLDYFAASDIFAMVSREDPFPVVCLEAAALHKPILCFDQGGGMQELVEDDSGFVVPYLDVATMADKAIALLESDTLRQSMGDRAAQKVRQRHHIDVVGRQILDVIDSVLQ